MAALGFTLSKEDRHYLASWPYTHFQSIAPESYHALGWKPLGPPAHGYSWPVKAFTHDVIVIDAMSEASLEVMKDWITNYLKEPLVYPVDLEAAERLVLVRYSSPADARLSTDFHSQPDPDPFIENQVRSLKERYPATSTRELRKQVRHARNYGMTSDQLQQIFSDKETKEKKKK